MARYLVRYGAMRILALCDAPGDQQFARAARVIVRTDRGLESGEVLCEATERVIAELTDPPHGQILRQMTPDDSHELRRMHAQEASECEVCRQSIERLGLPMDLVGVEHLFGGERIIVYYLAEGRVDFRELVRVLAGEFQTRIEMRQIGVRDEAKLKADYGDCGTPVCCNNHLVSIPPVSMKMAKLQKATLDPTKISGRCGRLKCCLRYEYDVYERLLAELPPVGTRIATADGRGRVIGHEVLASQVLVENENRVRKLVPLAHILPPDPPSAPSGGETLHGA